MHVSYVSVEFNLKFREPCLADTNLLFVLRSMLGKNLRAMCCISKKSKCPDCQFSRKCAYAFLFETILSSENSTLPGRNRASHPFSLSSKTQFKNFRNPLDEYQFSATLFGTAADYLPYIYAAFVRSGNDGLFKSRTKFRVEGVSFHGKNILIDENHLDLNLESDEWKCEFGDDCHNEQVNRQVEQECRHVERSETSNEKRDSSASPQNDGAFGNPRVQNDGHSEFISESVNGQTLKRVQGDGAFGNQRVQNGGFREILINLKSPLRFKVHGKYTADFSAADFMSCLFRRAKTLCSLYGGISGAEKNLWKISADGIKITERNLRWEDERHYSARQKKAMELGGVVGTFKMKGNFTDAEIALLDFAQIAGAGKNTNFGLGQMEVWGK